MFSKSDDTVFSFPYISTNLGAEPWVPGYVLIIFVFINCTYCLLKPLLDERQLSLLLLPVFSAHCHFGIGDI